MSTAVRALNANGDWTFGQGLNNYLRDNAAVTQNIGTRCKLFYGECFFALTQGIDWLNLLGAKNQVALNLAITSTITGTDFVTGVQQFSTVYDPSTRNFAVDYQVVTTYSTIQTTGAFTLNGSSA